MVPMKKKKKNVSDSKINTEQVILKEEQDKKSKFTSNAVKSISEQVVSDKMQLEREKEVDEAKSTSTPVVKRKPCTWLKLDRLNPQNGSELSVKNSEQDKGTKSSPQVEVSNDQIGKRTKYSDNERSDPNCRQKQDESLNEDNEGGPDALMRKETEERDGNSDISIGGLIFMCNSKTKPDCFRYQIMGVPANKKEIVLGIKCGLKIFLYDYDLKILYGIYVASSAGGMKLEPAAFGGGFPAQVRFTVEKDCLPLPESVFRKAIQGSYDKKTHKFDTELTVKQVENLVALFQPTPWLNLTSLGHEKQLTDHLVSSSTLPSHAPLFLSEQEYRSYGLQQGRNPFLPTAEGGGASHSLQPNKVDQQLKQLLKNPASKNVDSALRHIEGNQHDPFFLGEKEYHTYGLRIPQNNVYPMTTNEISTFNPSEESTASLVNRYLTLPSTTARPADPYLLHGRANYANDIIHSTEMRNHPGMSITHGERPSAPYRLLHSSNLNQGPYTLYVPPQPPGLGQGLNLRQETNFATAPVSSQYAFAQPYIHPP